MKVYGFGKKNNGVFEIENSLEAFQEYVGGYIESIGLTSSGLVIICDEEGKIKGKDYTITCKKLGIDLVGDIFIARENHTDEDFTDIREDDIKVIESIFGIE